MKSTVSFFLLMFLLASNGYGWTPKTYQVIVVKSVRLMPRSFQSIMLRHKEEILTGCLQPDDREETEHSYNLQTRDGYLSDRVKELTESIPEKITKHRPFREIAVDFGRLAHYLSDLNDPLLLGDQDPREAQYRDDFPAYMEKNLDIFPWIFDGHDNTLLGEDDLNKYLFEIASNAVIRYPRLGEAYFPNGVLISSDTFDYKSLPFGIASLSYSKSITSTVQIWFHTWKKAHGDITHTPLYSRSKKE